MQSLAFSRCLGEIALILLKTEFTHFARAIISPIAQAIIPNFFFFFFFSITIFVYMHMYIQGTQK